MDGRRPIILLAVALAVSGCQDEQTALLAPPDPVQGGVAGADRAGPAVADSTTEAEECELVAVEVEVEGETRTVYLCRRESEAAGGSASADGDGTQICWYWVVEYRIAGILVGRTEELLFCEEDDGQGGGGGGCGGGGGGGGGGQTECVSASLTLTCTTTTRGSVGGCTVTVAEDDDVDESALVFAWKSGFDAAWTDTTGTADSEWSSEWSGKATDDTEITVTVSGGGIAETSQSETVAVQARTWTLKGVSATPQHVASLPAVVQSERGDWGSDEWGFHVWQVTDPVPVKGSGPWENVYMTDAEPRFLNAIYLHSDLVEGGVAHPGANLVPADSLCSATTLPSSANVWTVNKECGSGGSLETWNNDVRAHEIKHQNSLNACIISTTATNAMQVIEALVGTEEQVEAGLELHWDTDFFPELQDAAETPYAEPSSPFIWEYRYNGAWKKHSLILGSHSGTWGC